MKITQEYLTPNKYSRPTTELKALKAIVIHWTANPKASAEANRNYFNNLPEINRANIENKKPEIYASAHYIIGLEGEIIKCMSEREVAYHCGAKRYTERAREKFGLPYVTYLSPNFCTIGIELCPIDEEGNFTAATIESAVELCADICKRYGLTICDIMTHNEITGKDCPRLWVNRPELFDAFKASVNDYIHRGEK